MLVRAGGQFSEVLAWRRFGFSYRYPMYSMDWSARCAVVIPCLNEAGTIGSLVRKVRRQLPSVIVVDDGSTDETGKRAEAAGAEVVRHETTRGKGAALASGWQRAQARGFLWALNMDGDG